MLIVRRLAATLGLALLVGAAVVMLWPIEANGVSGNAVRPHYGGWFAFESSSPMPAHPTRDDFLEAGIAWPHDVVHNRRTLAATTAAAGAVLIATAAVTMKRGAARDSALGASKERSD